MWNVVFCFNIFIIVARCTSDNSSSYKTNDQKEIKTEIAHTSGSVALGTAASISSAKVKSRNINEPVSLLASKLPLGPTDLYLDVNHGTAASDHNIAPRKQAPIETPSLKGTRIDTSLQDSTVSKDLLPQSVSVSPDESKKLNTSEQNKRNQIHASEAESISETSAIYPIEGGPVVSEHIKKQASIGKDSINVSGKANNSAFDIYPDNKSSISEGNLNKVNAVRDGNQTKEKGVSDGNPTKENSVSEGKPTKVNAVRDGNLTKEKAVSDGNPTKEKGVSDGKSTKENGVSNGNLTKEKGVSDGNLTKEIANQQPAAKPEHRVPKPTVTVLTDDKTDRVNHEKSEIYHFNDNHINQPGIVFPIVLTVAIVPLFAALGFMALRKGREAWKNRHYRRMDFLLDGMYND